MTYLIFHIALAAIGVVTYALLEFYIIPEVVEQPHKAMASAYTSYALTIYLTILTIGSYISKHFEEKAAGLKAGKRRS
jgi:hypothetical protein